MPSPTPAKKPPPTHARAAKRRCLRCGETFASDGPQNRICKPCKHLNEMRLRGDTVARYTGL